MIYVFLHNWYRYDMIFGTYVYSELHETIWWNYVGYDKCGLICQWLPVRNDELYYLWEMMNIQSMIWNDVLHDAQKRGIWKVYEHVV